MRPTLLLLIVSLLAGSSFAQEHPTQPAAAHDPHHVAAPEPHHATAHQAAPDAEPHPTLSSDPSWAGGLTTFIITLFILAAAVGSLARLSLPEEPPQPADSHGQDEHDAHGGAHTPAHGHH